MRTFKTSPNSILAFVSCSCKNSEYATNHCSCAAVICHVQIYVVAPIVRTTIVKNELTLMISSMMMMILVNIKMETLMENQMVKIVVQTNCMKMMK